MIFEKEKFAEKLHNYYLSHYGEKESDIWYEQPAVNVWVFKREDKIITLKCHVLTLEITEQIEKVNRF